MCVYVFGKDVVDYEKCSVAPRGLMAGMKANGDQMQPGSAEASL